jgi:hypothetical protein
LRTRFGGLGRRTRATESLEQQVLRADAVRFWEARLPRRLHGSHAHCAANLASSAEAVQRIHERAGHPYDEIHAVPLKV